MTPQKQHSAHDHVQPPAKTARDERLERLIDRLPRRVGSAVRWLRQPSSFWIRMPAGALLICGGLVSFLPIFSLWMLPLGLLLLAEDVPSLRSATSRVLDWIERRYPHWLVARRADKPDAKLEHELGVRNGHF
jgi:hypothetical protein